MSTLYDSAPAIVVDGDRGSVNISGLDLSHGDVRCVDDGATLRIYIDMGATAPRVVLQCKKWEPSK